MDRREQYLDQRQQLVWEDERMSVHQEIHLDSLERWLDSSLIAMRDSMIRVYKDQHFFPPARNFFQSKQHIEETKLFEIFRSMPKGGILHLHDAAAGNARWVIDRITSDENAYVYWGQPNQTYTKGQIGYFTALNAPAGFVKTMSLDKQVQNLPDSLMALLTFDESIDADSVDIWKEFELIFQRIYGFVRYQPVFRDYTYHYLDQLVQDGIQHVELRSLITGLYHEQRAEGYYNADSVVAYFQEVAEKIKEKEPAFTLKIIFTSLRFRSNKQVLQDLASAYQLRQKYPDLIKGFDLVAEEDQGHSTLFFLDTWIKMDSLQQAYGVDMPLYLHDGESDWISSSNLYDAVLLDSKRIGHGFNLFRFPALLEKVQQKGICLEINPISNQVLGFIRDLRLHPASNYLARGIPCAISSDDPLIFDYQGLSYDTWEVFMAWELGLADLKGLAINSLKYSALNQQEQAESLEHFNRKWRLFVNEAIQQLSINN
jgi:adenosine deaminase CECR1